MRVLVAVEGIVSLNGRSQELKNNTRLCGWLLFDVLGGAGLLNPRIDVRVLGVALIP